MRLIRIDDYPWGEPVRVPSQARDILATALKIFNEHNVPYILGVTPELINDSDIEFLNKNIISGHAVMHGFNHAFDFSPWERITETWPKGGEFASKTVVDLQSKYKASHYRMRRLNRYDPKHFVAPFNCYNQNLLMALRYTDVRFLHTCDKEYDAYGYENLDHYDLTPIISKYHVTYDYASKVIDHLDDDSQITLHWMYDCQRPNWQQDYVNLCRAL